MLNISHEELHAEVRRLQEENAMLKTKAETAMTNWARHINQAADASAINAQVRIELIRLREKNEELSKAQQWQPIETAPRDGTVIWAYLFQTGIRQLQWVSAEQACEFFGEPDEAPDDFEPNWAEAEDWGQQWSPQWWLPLEAIPKAPESGE